MEFSITLLHQLYLPYWRECLTTGKANVAIHHSKALSLSIVRGPFSQSFIKGMSRNLPLKSSAYSEHFPLILLFILKKLGSPRSGLWSGNEWQNTFSLSSEQKIADRTYISSSKENVHHNMEEIDKLSLWRDYVRLNTARSFPTELTNFKGFGTLLSVKPTFYKGTCPLEWKCSLNAELFKRKLRLIPFIKIYKNSQWTLLKERAFEWCIAT